MKKFFYITTPIIIAILFFYIYKLTTYTYINIKFKELRPCNCRIPVYYKGIKIGKATERKHSDDYTYTIVKVVLYPKNLMLPNNTEVLLKKEKKNNKEYDFLEFIYPQKPSTVMISNGSMLEGKTTIDLQTFLKNQHPDDINQIKENIYSASENLNESLTQLVNLLILIQDILKENQSNIMNFSGGLAKSAKNINQITYKFNKSIKQQSLENTINNLNTSSQNIATITNGLNTTTNSVNTAMPNIDSAIYQTNGLLYNMNKITCGIKGTLSKPFGGLRILFGKTVNDCDKQPCRP